MTPQHDLVALALRVESGDEDRGLHALIVEATGGCAHRKTHRIECDNDGYDLVCTSCGSDDLWLGMNPVTSLDAVVALIEEKLPGWAYAAINEKLRGPIGYVHNNEPSFVGVAAHPNPAKVWIERRAPTPARALLAATLRAMKEEGR